MYSIKGFTGMGTPRTCGFSRYFLIYLNAFLQASSHLKLVSFFISQLNGWYRHARFDIKCQMHARWPCKLRSSRKFFSSGILWIASILDWSTSIPQCRMIKPRNYPDVTPNAHFKRFILIWYFLSRLNTMRKFRICSSFFLVLTTKPST